MMAQVLVGRLLSLELVCDFLLRPSLDSGRSVGHFDFWTCITDAWTIRYGSIFDTRGNRHNRYYHRSRMLTVCSPFPLLSSPFLGLLSCPWQCTRVQPLISLSDVLRGRVPSPQSKSVLRIWPAPGSAVSSVYGPRPFVWSELGTQFQCFRRGTFTLQTQLGGRDDHSGDGTRFAVRIGMFRVCCGNLPHQRLAVKPVQERATAIDVPETRT